MKIYILQWSNQQDRWTSNIHNVGYFSSFKKAELAAGKHGELKFGFGGSPWVLIDRGEWACSRDNINYNMWISKEKVE